MSTPFAARVARLVLAGATAVAVLAGAGPAYALLTSTATVAGNTLATGTWTNTFYLHHYPTPPTANTTSQVSLPLDRTAPTATTLYQYSTDIAAVAGRIVLRSNADLADTNPQDYASWRTQTLLMPYTLSGTVTVALWSQPRTRYRPGAMTVFLRDYSAEAGTYAEIGSQTYTNSNWAPGGKWVLVSVPIAGVSQTLAAGHALELRVMVPSSSAEDILLGYDTTSYASTMVLP